MDVPWPKRGDRLFVSGGPGPLYVHVLGEPFPFPVAGYKRAGDTLIQGLIEHGRDDALVYPIVFCYRHYVELRLKELIDLLDKLDEADKSYRNNHNLDELWSIILSRVNRNDYRDEQEAFDAVGQCVAELHEVDARGTGFRYRQQLQVSQINLLNLYSVMDGVATFLDSLSDFLTNTIENRG